MFDVRPLVLSAVSQHRIDRPTAGGRTGKLSQQSLWPAGPPDPSSDRGPSGRYAIPRGDRLGTHDIAGAVLAAAGETGVEEVVIGAHPGDPRADPSLGTTARRILGDATFRSSWFRSPQCSLKIIQCISAVTRTCSKAPSRSRAAPRCARPPAVLASARSASGRPLSISHPRKAGRPAIA